MYKTNCRNKIELLRIKLNQLVLEKGTLTDEQVISLSKELDKYIMEYQNYEYGTAFIPTSSKASLSAIRMANSSRSS